MASDDRRKGNNTPIKRGQGIIESRYILQRRNLVGQLFFVLGKTFEQIKEELESNQELRALCSSRRGFSIKTIQRDIEIIREDWLKDVGIPGTPAQVLMEDLKLSTVAGHKFRKEKLGEKLNQVNNSETYSDKLLSLKIIEAMRKEDETMIENLKKVGLISSETNSYGVDGEYVVKFMGEGSQKG